MGFCLAQSGTVRAFNPNALGASAVELEDQIPGRPPARVDSTSVLGPRGFRVQGFGQLGSSVRELDNGQSGVCSHFCLAPSQSELSTLITLALPSNSS